MSKLFLGFGNYKLGFNAPETESSDVPTLPQATVDTTYSLPTGGTTYYAYGDGGAHDEYNTTLASALSSASLGDVIVLEAGETYTGNFTFPDKGAGTDWIYITTSDYANLPAEGTRVGPSDAGNMAKILTSNLDRAMTIPQGAHHVRFVGIEFASDNVSYTDSLYAIVTIGTLSGATSTDEFPHHVIFDRVYIHGTTAGNVRQGIDAIAVNEFACIESYIEEIHSTSEAHAIQLIASGGPAKVDNNFLSASGICLFFGDSFHVYDGSFCPTDVTVTKNYLWKSRTWDDDSGEYAGVYWMCKHSFEVKHCTRMLVEGNEFDTAWSSPANTAGYGFLLSAWGGIIQHVTIRKNYIHDTWRGFYVVSPDFDSHDVLVENNVLQLDGNRGFELARSDGGPTTNVTVRHNTILGLTDRAVWIAAGGGTPASVNVTVYDNIIATGAYGIGGTGYAGLDAVQYYLSTYDWNVNLMVGSASAMDEDATCRGFLYETAESGVGFVTTPRVNLADYALAVSSDYYQAGSDGADIGADIDAIVAAMA